MGGRWTALRRFAAAALGALALAAVWGAGTPAQAQTRPLLDAAKPEGLLEVMRRFGGAALGVDALGDPEITGDIAGRPYQVIFHDCENGRDCGVALFVAGYTGTAATAEDMARWNRESLFGTAYLDSDGDPIIDFVVNLDGGVSEENWTRTLYWWVVALADFERFLEQL